MVSAQGESTGAGPSGPLAGVRVLDLSSVVMGPLATQILGDLGAEVVSIEAEGGDTNRVMGPGPHRQLSGVSLNLLRNKRNVSLDLKDPAGREVFLRLAAVSDVVITNLRPGPLGRLRLAYDDVRAVRPDIVFCQAHGWATGSGRENAPAFDDVIQAASGISELEERVTGERVLAPTLIADKLCGVTMAYSVMAALFHRERTGEGQHIEVPMADVTSAFMLVEHGAGAIPEPAFGPAGYERILTRERRSQHTSDGWINVLPFSTAHYEAIWAAGGRTDLANDPRVVTGSARIANAESLYRDVADVLVTRPTSFWLEYCTEHSIPSSAVRTVDDLVAELPIVEHPVVGMYREIPSPVRFSRTPASVRRPAPLIGEHGREVLAELGMSPAEIDALEASGVLRQPSGTR